MHITEAGSTTHIHAARAQIQHTLVLTQDLKPITLVLTQDLKTLASSQRSIH